MSVAAILGVPKRGVIQLATIELNSRACYSPDRLPSYIEGLNKYRPEVLTGYTSSDYSLARMMLESGFQLHYQPKALVLSSEKLTLEMKRSFKRQRPSSSPRSASVKMR